MLLLLSVSRTAASICTLTYACALIPSSPVFDVILSIDFREAFGGSRFGFEDHRGG